MGPKYKFTNITIKYDGHILHEIKRLSDGKLGGWIEKEENLSQEGNCWVDGEAKVYGDAKVEGNAQVCDYAEVYDNAKVYGNAHVFRDARVYGDALVRDDVQVADEAEVYGDARVYDDALVRGHAKVYGDAEVYDYAKVYGQAKVYGDAKVFGNVDIYGNAIVNNNVHFSGKYTGEEYTSNLNEVVQDFIYKVDDSNKIMAQTEYDSVDEFFNEPIANDIKLDTLVIYTIDTKEPLIKLQKVETDNKTEFKFIVDITNEDGDDFRFRSIIKSQEQLNQLIQQTIEALKLYPKFSKYADDLENCE